MQHPQSTPPHESNYLGLISGLDPLKVEHAQMIVGKPRQHSPQRCVLAFRTIKESRGETVSPDFINQALRTATQIGGAA